MGENWKKIYVFEADASEKNMNPNKSERKQMRIKNAFNQKARRKTEGL